MRRALCSLGVGPHEELLQLTAPSFAAFAKRHHYDLHLFTERRSHERPVPWSKIPILQELLASYEEVLWIDADAVVVDDSRDIASAVGDGALMGICPHRTPEGDDPIPNAGVWFLRSEQETLSLLSDIWNCTAYVNHKWWENAALLDVMGYELEPTVRLVQPSPIWSKTTFLTTEWNSIPVDSSPNPRILHFAGMSQEERIAAIKSALLSRSAHRGSGTQNET
ncbi:MAG TPA: putative nucleotide-diphospho-sugar transferase [Acidimicrobiales bacterium]